MDKAWLWAPLAMAAMAGAAYGVFISLQAPELPPGILYGNGHIEGTEVNVSAEVTARVLESRLEEGTAVAAGDLLVRLDDAEIGTRLAAARAEAEAVRLEQAVVSEELGTWRHHVETARLDLERYRELREQEAITPQRLREAEDRAREAEGRVETLEARKAALAARLEAARRQVTLLELRLDKTRIHAPVAGTVLAKTIEVGELATPGRVVATLVDLSRLELVVYVSERALGKVRLGDPARIRIDAFPDGHFEARVARVSQQAEFTPRDVHMPEERVRMVFGVTLALRNEQGYLKPGMPADAWIRWDADGRWPDRLVVPR